MRVIYSTLIASLLLFVSCVEELETGSRELSYDELYVVKAQMEELLETSVEGEEEGNYPSTNFDQLEVALTTLKRGIAEANAGVFILQFEVDNYVTAAQKAIKLFEDAVIVFVKAGEDAELFVNGVNGGYIDFGSSTEFTPSNLTVEAWLKYPEGYLEFGFGSLISTFISPLPYKGWTVHFWGVVGTMLRFSPGTDNPNSDLTLPTIYTTAPTTYDTWFHFAAVMDINNDYIALYINGEESATMEMTDNMVPCTTTEECRMWAFVEPKDNSRCVSGTMKNFRLWSTPKSQEEIQTLMNSDVEGNESNLVCAWDFTVKPEDDTNIPDKTGRYSASINGLYKWNKVTE